MLHLPGHSPDSIALLDEEDGLFFSGDAIDDQLLDDLPDSDRDAYRRTMQRLLDLPIRIGLGGHDRPSTRHACAGSPRLSRPGRSDGGARPATPDEFFCLDSAGRCGLLGFNGAVAAGSRSLGRIRRRIRHPAGHPRADDPARRLLPLGQGWRTALPMAVGVAFGDFTAMTLSMLGIGALLAASATVFCTEMGGCGLSRLSPA